MSSVKEILVEARGLIEKGWTQKVYARDAEGNDVPSCDPAAVCFCSVGAITKTVHEKAAIDMFDDVVRSFSLILYMLPSPRLIAHWNDQPDRTKEEVLAVFDKAIILSL